jgi:hypothetical protein
MFLKTQHNYHKDATLVISMTDGRDIIFDNIGIESITKITQSVRDAFKK